MYTRVRTVPVTQWGTAGEYVGRISANCHLNRLRFCTDGVGRRCWNPASLMSGYKHVLYLDDIRLNVLINSVKRVGVGFLHGFTGMDGMFGYGMDACSGDDQRKAKEIFYRDGRDFWIWDGCWFWGRPTQGQGDFLPGWTGFLDMGWMLALGTTDARPRRFFAGMQGISGMDRMAPQFRRVVAGTILRGGD